MVRREIKRVKANKREVEERTGAICRLLLWVHILGRPSRFLHVAMSRRSWTSTVLALHLFADEPAHLMRAVFHLTTDEPN